MLASLAKGIGTEAPWRQAAHRLARYGWYVLLVGLALGLLGGVLSALDGPGGAPEAVTTTEDDLCPNPPCLDMDLAGMPPSAIPNLLQLLGYTLAAVLGVPSLLAGGQDLLRGRRALGAGRLLAFLGPLLILVGTELVPHAIDVCRLLPWACEDSPRHGWSIADQWHQLDHALIGALPLTILYGWALRRWHPAFATSKQGKDG